MTSDMITVVDERVAPNFWLSEFLRSDTAVRRGIRNVPTPEHLANIRAVLAPGMQRIRNLLGVPVTITSGYRSPELNEAVGGSRNSQHSVGLAADFVAPSFGSPREICVRLARSYGEIRYDQLIYEGTWVHVSFCQGEPRGQILTARFGPGGVSYINGIA